MDITTDRLNPEHVIKVGDGYVNNYPKVIEQALHHCELKWRMMTGLSGQIWLCKACAAQLEYTDKDYTFTSGTFRVQHGEDMYMEASYYREKELRIENCLSCGTEKVNGCRYRISVKEITYIDDHLRVFQIGDEVIVWKIGSGKITGWTDEREQYRRYHITFKDGSKGKFVHWQMVKERR